MGLLIGQVFLLALIYSLKIAEALQCYRCDSAIDEGCPFYPAPLSTFEVCQDLSTPSKAIENHRSYISDEREKVYIRYRYKTCPIFERTIEQLVLKTPNPLEVGKLVCAKVITHTSLGVRVRRGCTPDHFLGGTEACVEVYPHGNTDIACYCSSDLCNFARTSTTSNNTSLIISNIVAVYSTISIFGK